MTFHRKRAWVRSAARTTVFFFAVAFTGVVRAEPHVFKREGEAMGTKISFSAWTSDEATCAKAFDLAFKEVIRIEQLMTDWDRPGQPPSDVVRINNAGPNVPVAVAAETFEVLEAGQRMAVLSDGAFDLSYAALRGLWRFDEDMAKRIPPKRDIARAVAAIGYRYIRLDPQKRTITLKRRGMRIGLGGIAKGYAIDRAAAILEKNGVTSFMVQAGGDLLVRGAKGEKPWMVGIRDPRSTERGNFFAVAPIHDHAFSTAGDYERSFILDGKRYHHILDPKTGFPASRCRSVTIFAPSALAADALDDAVFVLGAKKGLALVEASAGAGAVIVDDKNQVHVSKRLEGIVQMVSPPTPGL